MSLVLGAEPAIRKLMTEFGERPALALRDGRAGARSGSRASLRRHRCRRTCRAALVEEWLRVSEQTGAPLDPLLWAEAPLRTTYPACMAVKAAAEQAPDGGYAYLRRLREGIMCERRKLDARRGADRGRRARSASTWSGSGSALRSHAITEAFGADLEATAALAGEAQRSRWALVGG